jgi:hypothetical protein
MGIWQSIGEERVCLWPAAGFIRSPAYGEWQHVSYLSGQFQGLGLAAPVDAASILHPSIRAVKMVRTEVVSLKESPWHTCMSPEIGKACHDETVCGRQDAMRTPIKLNCSHLFCDTCISTWLARNRSCPMCRTIVRPAGVMTLGDGASPLPPLVF